MPSHSETRIVPYSSGQLFELVMDIERYPEFLPWCIGARINDFSANDLDADVVIGYKMFREKFSSRVHFTRPGAKAPNENSGRGASGEIEVEYLKGPMRHLHNKWVFTDLKQNQCQVEFYVDFSLKTKVFESIVDQFFHRALVKMIDAFELRAVELYSAKRR
jgi:coenzyme Q-binding protein COQ10